MLVVDDHEQFRRLIRLALAQRGDFQIIGEASDGAEALEKAGALQPDLILMDVGLPKLSGTEAAGRLRKLVPHARVLIVSYEFSSDVVRESLRSGAAGYVHKADIYGDLLPAIEAALAGEQFLSRSVADSTRETAEYFQPRFRHEVQLYSDDSIFRDCVVRFLASTLKTGGAAIAVATRPHQESILHGLYSRGVDVDAAIRQGLYVSLDVADALSTFMVDGLPDRARFLGGFSTLIESVSTAIKVDGSRVALFGEGAPLLWAEGRTEAAIKVEQLAQELAQNRGVDILCAYPVRPDYQEDKNALSRICAAHTAVVSG